MQTRITAAFLTAALVSPLSATAQQAFLDEFDTLDRDRWYVSDGWSNGAHQNCIWSADRVAVVDGHLNLSLTTDGKDDFDLSCAEVQSTARQGFGTYEARMKVPYAKGMNASMFSFIGAQQKKPHNEIDFEFLARDEPVLQTNFHTSESGGHEELHKMPDDQTFRTYSFIWEPDRIRWFIDGDLIRDVREGTLPEARQKMYLTLWSTDRLIDWMGKFDPASAPQTLEIDWVAYTPLGQDCAFQDSVLCEPDVSTE